MKGGGCTDTEVLLPSWTGGTGHVSVSIPGNGAASA